MRIHPLVHPAHIKIESPRGFINIPCTITNSVRESAEKERNGKRRAKDAKESKPYPVNVECCCSKFVAL